MPLIARLCVIGKCDICGYVYDHEEQAEEHFESTDAASQQLADAEWTFPDDGRVICPADDCRNAA